MILYFVLTASGSAKVGPFAVCNFISCYRIVNDSVPGLVTVGYNSTCNYNIVTFYWERDLMQSFTSMGCRGSGVVPLEMAAAFADNAGSAMLATPTRVSELPLIIVCILAAVGECSTIYY